MTSQSVAYGSLLEEVRHNKVGEVEQNRHNVVTETETNRHNIVTEEETKRHDLAIEGIQSQANAITKAHYERADSISLMNAQETKRNHLVMEGIAAGNLGVSQGQLSVSQGQLAVALSQYELAHERLVQDWNISTREFMYMDVPKANAQVALWEAQSQASLANAAHTQQQTVLDRVGAPISFALTYAQTSNHLSQATLNSAKTLESYTKSLDTTMDLTGSLLGTGGKKKKYLTTQ